MSKKRAVVICPGRGTYNAAELGYLKKYHADKTDFLDMIDAVRARAGQGAITELDAAERFSPSQHGRGDNASLLIYACAMADFQSIDREKYDIVGVSGNSMGWYLSLAACGAVSLEDGATLVNTMGKIMTDHGVGGQVVFSRVNDEWQKDTELVAAVQKVIDETDDLSLSIDLGGMSILAGSDAAIKTALTDLPKSERFPFQIRGHSAFHSPLLNHCVPLAHKALSPAMFKKPTLPLIDGVGQVWTPLATDIERLDDYTLGRQVNATYNFSKAVTVSTQEFAPDVFIILGPGTTMGAPVAQTLIAQNWENLDSKSAFKTRQLENPIILSMGMPEQRHLVTK